MLRTMRANAKWVFYILAIAFVAWLAIGQVMSILGPSGNVVLRVNGREFQVAEYQRRVQVASQQYLTSDVYVSDAKLWRIYRDQHDSVRIASLAIWPYTVPDTSAISDAELAAYVAKHPDDFKRPAVAYVRFIAQPRLPNAADSAVARTHVARVRNELVHGAKFEDVARRESSDTN